METHKDNHHQRLESIEKLVLAGAGFVEAPTDAKEAEEEMELVMTLETARERMATMSANLEESVWDAALFIGNSFLGSAASVMTFIAISINVFCQVFFCAMALEWP